MKPLLKVRYVLVSDYATVDHTGKFIVAGLYTEDMVVPSIPTQLASIVFTVLIETPEREVPFHFTIEAPSGSVIAGGDGAIGPGGAAVGGRPRAVLGFQFNNVLFNEGGDYKVVLSGREGGRGRQEIHQFRVLVSPEAHAEATAPLAKRSPVAPPQ